MKWSPQSRWVPIAVQLLEHYGNRDFTGTEAVRDVPNFKHFARELREHSILIRKYRGYTKGPSIYAISREAQEWLKTQGDSAHA